VSAERLSSELGICLEKEQLQAVSFLEDRLSFSPNTSNAVAPLEPDVGRAKEIDINICKDAEFKLKSNELLGFSLTLKCTTGLSVSVKPLVHVIPTGIYNDLKRIVLRNPSNAVGEGSANFNAVPARIPLLTYRIENCESRRRKLAISTICNELGVNRTDSIDLQPLEAETLTTTPDLPEPVPLFSEATILQDHDFGLRPAEFRITIQEHDLEIKDGPKLIRNQYLGLQALPLDYMVWAITNGRDGRFVDLRYLICKWVTPNAQKIQDFLDSIGLQTSTEKAGEDLMRVYDELLSFNFEYDNSRLNFGALVEHEFQRVRLPSVSLTHRLINCIDGTVLLASFMERLRYETIIVFIPHHTFLGVIAEGTFKSAKRMLFIESTGLCSHWFKSGNGVKFDDKLPCGRALSYREATEIGLQLFEENETWLLRDRTKMQRATNPIEFGLSPYCLLIVPKVRSEGIVPFFIDREKENRGFL
jgi:hypothetical protein